MTPEKETWQKVGQSRAPGQDFTSEPGIRQVRSASASDLIRGRIIRRKTNVKPLLSVLSLAPLILTALAGPVTAADDPQCLAEYKAEEARITREAERKAAAIPPGNDTGAQQRLMAGVHDGLKAAAERAERCNRARRPPPPADASQRMKQCADRADQQMTELRQRYAGQSKLSFEEQTTIRSEENRIATARMDCMQKVR